MAKSTSIARQVGDAVSIHISKHGDRLICEHEQSCMLLTEWLQYLRSSQDTGVASELLDGLHAAIIEVSGCLALGLVRPAIFSLRAQVDILFAWLFFKDHQVEWNHVETTGRKYRLVSEVQKDYLLVYFPKVKERIKILREKRTSGEENPYSLLSAHVHSQNSSTLPPLVSVSELIQDKKLCTECIGMQKEISEYMSDVLTSIFARQWPDLPNKIRDSVTARIDEPKLQKLCS